MIIKGYIPLLFSKDVSTTQPQTLAWHQNKMNEIRRKARETDVRGHVTSKAPMAVRDSPVKSYSFHTQSSLISLFRAEKRSAQASVHPLSQAQGGLFCVLTVFVFCWSSEWNAWGANVCSTFAPCKADIPTLPIWSGVSRFDVLPPALPIFIRFSRFIIKFWKEEKNCLSYKYFLRSECKTLRTVFIRLTALGAY